MSERFKQLATECARLIGFEKPVVNDNFYALLIDDLRVLIEPKQMLDDKEGLIFCCHIGQLTNMNRAQVSDFLLQKSADFTFSGAVSLGVLPESNMITVYQVLPAEVDRAVLVVDELNQFVDIAERTAKEVAQFKQTELSQDERPLANLMSV